MTKTDATKTYHDGSHEDWLYETVVKNGVKDPLEILKKNSSWFVLNQVSPRRESLLYPFEFKGSTLEVGAGCGPLTGVLLEKSEKVTSLELSKQRADILESRHRCEKLTVLSGEFSSVSVDGGFDNVVVVGVLEYAGEFYKSENPFVDFLQKCRSYLKPGGKLFLAIENKLGIKYLAGCAEDHYGSIFEGIQDYPNYFGRRTFSKRELIEMLKEVGLEFFSFNYPFPDYKLPIEIHSDWSLQNLNVENNGFLPTEDLSLPREYLFSEALFLRSLRNADILDRFANSFIVEASDQDIFTEQREAILYSKLSSNRINEKKKYTSIVTKNGERYVTKSSRSKSKNGFEEIRKVLERSFSIPSEKSIQDGSDKVTYIEGDRLDGKAFELLVQKNLVAFREVFKDLKTRLLKCFPDGIVPTYIDLNLSNFIVKESEIYLIDIESILDSKVQIELIILRSQVDFYSNNFQAIFSLFKDISCFSDFYKLINEIDLSKQIETEFLGFENKISLAYFDREIKMESIDNNTHRREAYTDLVTSKNDLSAKLGVSNDEVENLRRERDHLQKSLEEASKIIDNLVANIENSKAMKAARIIKKILRKK